MSCPSSESSVGARIDNAIHFMDQAKHDVLLSVAFERPPEIRAHLDRVKAMAVAAHIGDFVSVIFNETDANAPLTMRPPRLATAYAFATDQGLLEEPILVNQWYPQHQPRLVIVNPIYAYDEVLVDWRAFSQPGIRRLTIGGAPAIEAFINDLRDHAVTDKNFDTIADLSLIAVNYAQRTIPQ